MAKKTKAEIVKEIAIRKEFGYLTPKSPVVSNTFKEILLRHGIKYGEPTDFPQVGFEDSDGDTGEGGE